MPKAIHSFQSKAGYDPLLWEARPAAKDSSCQRKAKLRAEGSPPINSSGVTPVLWEARPRGEKAYQAPPKTKLARTGLPPPRGILFIH